VQKMGNISKVSKQTHLHNVAADFLLLLSILRLLKLLPHNFFPSKAMDADFVSSLFLSFFHNLSLLSSKFSIKYFNKHIVTVILVVVRQGVPKHMKYTHKFDQVLIFVPLPSWE
jgi:hypothetical protein